MLEYLLRCRQQTRHLLHHLLRREIRRVQSRLRYRHRHFQQHHLHHLHHPIALLYLMVILHLGRRQRQLLEEPFYHRHHQNRLAHQFLQCLRFG